MDSSDRSLKLYVEGVCKSVEKPPSDESEMTFSREESFRIKHQVTDPLKFNRLIPINPKDLASKLLPEHKYVVKEYPVSVSVGGNSKDVSAFAKQVAESNNETIINVLTRWLERGGRSMRIRRALHSELQNNGIDIETVD